MASGLKNFFRRSEKKLEEAEQNTKVEIKSKKKKGPDMNIAEGDTNLEKLE